MKKDVLLYGLLGGLLIAGLRAVEYRFLVLEHSLQVYGLLIAVLFAGVGVWLGKSFTQSRNTAIDPTTGAAPLVARHAAGGELPTVGADPARRADFGITKRELEILELMAAGLSNREIAERIYVSENTVKTHSSRLFEKLNARRRTQAVQIGKSYGLIP